MVDAGTCYTGARCVKNDILELYYNAHDGSVAVY